jgi:hypothetical protein
VTPPDHRGVLEAVDRIVNRGGERDGVLRAVLEALYARGATYAAIRVGDHELAVGTPAAATEAPIVVGGQRVGTLLGAAGDRAVVARTATFISPYFL